MKRAENLKTQTATTHSCSLEEEIANGITHGIGAALSIAGLMFLVLLAIKQNSSLHITTASIYGITLVLVYISSTLYHSIHEPHLKAFFRLMDHCAIYLFIAGTYTPVMLISLKGNLGYAMTGIIWVIALTGVLFKVCCRQWNSSISLLLYLMMGWMALIPVQQIMENMLPAGLNLLVIGGIIYTLGTIFYVSHRIPYNHAIWHLFVLAGSGCHFFMIYDYVLPVV